MVLEEEWENAIELPVGTVFPIAYIRDTPQ